MSGLFCWCCNERHLVIRRPQWHSNPHRWAVLSPEPCPGEGLQEDAPGRDCPCFTDEQTRTQEDWGVLFPAATTVTPWCDGCSAVIKHRWIELLRIIQGEGAVSPSHYDKENYARGLAVRGRTLPPYNPESLTQIFTQFSVQLQRSEAPGYNH